MVGPDPEGLGGISRVVKLWMSTRLFRDQNIVYIVSTDDSTRNKIITLLRSVIKFGLHCCTKPRLVYIHTASNNSFYRKSIFILFSMLFGKKIILHIHPSFFFTFLSGMNGMKKKVFFKLLQHVDRFIVLSKEMHVNMSTLFPHKAIYILPNPVDIQGMQSGKQIPRDNNRILYLGWYNRAKGVYDLVDAIDLLLSQGISISTDFYGTKEIEQLCRYVKDKGLDGCIHVHDWANNEKKIKALKQATMLVLPSYSEGIPNVILEAMASKVPIISTLVGGLTDVLRDGDNALIIKPGNIHDIAAKIKLALDNPKLRDRIAENAYKDAKKYFKLENIVNAFGKMVHEFALTRDSETCCADQGSLKK